MPRKKKKKEQFVDVFPVAPALKKIGGKWKGMIVCLLLVGTLRFNELLRSLPRCSQRMLANQLRELQADGIVRRKLFREIPPRVEYSLTDIGRDLLPMIRASCEWSHKHLQGAVVGYDCAFSAVVLEISKPASAIVSEREARISPRCNRMSVLALNDLAGQLSERRSFHSPRLAPSNKVKDPQE